jgi:hypothetical protein
LNGFVQNSVFSAEQFLIKNIMLIALPTWYIGKATFGTKPNRLEDDYANEWEMNS